MANVYKDSGVRRGGPSSFSGLASQRRWRVSSAVVLWGMGALRSSVLCVCSATVGPGFFRECVAGFGPRMCLEDFVLYISSRHVCVLGFAHAGGVVVWLSGLCILFAFSIFSVWRGFHGGSSGGPLFAVAWKYFHSSSDWSELCQRDQHAW